MAYIIGLLTPEEEKELEERGWELEEAPKELGPEKDIPGKVMKMVWVDSGMVDMMSGPDWEMPCNDGPPYGAATATGMYDG